MAKIPKPYNGGTMTAAELFRRLLRIMREYSMKYWKPGELYLRSIRRKNTGEGRHQYEYPCEACEQWFRREDVEKDHKIPVGKARTFEEFGKAVERLLIEIDGGWQCLCIDCHKAKSRSERGGV